MPTSPRTAAPPAVLHLETLPAPHLGMAVSLSAHVPCLDNTHTLPTHACRYTQTHTNTRNLSPVNMLSGCGQAISLLSLRLAMPAHTLYGRKYGSNHPFGRPCAANNHPTNRAPPICTPSLSHKFWSGVVGEYRCILSKTGRRLHRLEVKHLTQPSIVGAAPGW